MNIIDGDTMSVDNETIEIESCDYNDNEQENMIFDKEMYDDANTHDAEYDINDEVTGDYTSFRTEKGQPPTQRQGSSGGHGDQVSSEQESDVIPQVGEYAGTRMLNVKRFSSFKAGRISRKYDNWRRLTSDYKLLRDIKGYKIEFKELPWQRRPQKQIKFSEQEHEIVGNVISDFLEEIETNRENFQSFIIFILDYHSHNMCTLF